MHICAAWSVQHLSPECQGGMTSPSCRWISGAEYLATHVHIRLRDQSGLNQVTLLMPDWSLMQTCTCVLGHIKIHL